MLDLGFTYEEAKKETNFEPIEEGTYEVQVQSIEQRVGTESGRPYLNVMLSIINHPRHTNRKLFYTVPLDGSPLSKRKLVSLVSGVGATWTGTSFDEQSIVGLSGRAKVVYARTATGEVKERNGQPDMNIYFN